jgi:hypothetical protein
MVRAMSHMGRAPAFSAGECLGLTCPPGGAVASPYRESLPVTRRSPWPDNLCACRRHRHAETGMSPGMHTDPCSTRNRCVPVSLASPPACLLPVTRKTTAGAAVAVGTVAMRVHIVTLCSLAPCTACMASCLLPVVTSVCIGLPGLDCGVQTGIELVPRLWG